MGEAIDSETDQLIASLQQENEKLKADLDNVLVALTSALVFGEQKPAMLEKLERGPEESTVKIQKVLQLMEQTQRTRLEDGQTAESAGNEKLQLAIDGNF